MNLDNLGIPSYSSSDIFQAIYNGQLDKLKNLLVEESEETLKFNQSAIELDLEKFNFYKDPNTTKEYFDSTMQSQWLMPDEYKNMDIEGYLVNQCPKEHYQRLIDELQEFRERNMIELLRWLKYFVDTCRKHNVIWGVGRGSSVASYVLFLIGVHRIDSIKYNLDWREFLR